MLKYRLKNALLLSLLILALIGSCSKENASSLKVSLTSFGPSGVAHGETIKFIGTNLNQVTSIVLPVDVEVPASSFTTQTSTLIELVVPDASTTGYVTLKTPRGDVVSKTAFGSSYIISVASFTPTTAKPGTNITITGNFLNYVRQVTFSDGQKVTQFVSQSLNQLVVQVPMTAQTGGISLNDLAKTPSVVDHDDKGNALILIVNLPSVSSLSPSSIEQTKNLTIAGTDLDLVSEIDFTGGGKVMAPFVSQSSTQVMVKVPNIAVNGPLTLLAFSGVKTLTSQSVSVIEPAVTSLPAGRNGADIVITGTDLNLVASITFPDGGAGTSLASSSFKNIASDGTSLTVTIPASAIPGSIKLITIHDFTVTVTGFMITLPVAASYSSSTPGTTLQILGTDLDLVSSITFPDGSNGKSVSSTQFATINSGEIALTIPAGISSGGYLQFVIVNGFKILQKPKFGIVLGTDPIVDPSLVFFDFNNLVNTNYDKGVWWGDATVENDPTLSLDGSGYAHFNKSLTSWDGFFWRNGSDHFPGSTIGTNIASYVVKFDIKILTPITGGTLLITLKTASTEYDAMIGPGAANPTPLPATGGWITLSLPLTAFKDGYGWGSNGLTDLSLITSDFGMAFSNGSSTVNVAIDNVRFEHK